MKLQLINTGGTIVQAKTDDGQGMGLTVSPSDLISDLGVSVEVDTINALIPSSADFSLKKIVEICKILNETDANYLGNIITIGTDVLEEVAYAIDYFGPYTKPVVLVAAMRPSTALGYDGYANLYSAVILLTDGVLEAGDVVVTISDKIHSASKISKIHSERIDAFESCPGHIGEMQNGRPIISFKPANSLVKKNIGIKELPTDFPIPKVGLITAHIDMPVDFFNLSSIDGLVVAGMGTGSISQQLLDYLTAQHPLPIPIIVSTRCTFGLGYNDWLYMGGIEKYEKLGFVLRDFSGLNSLKARMKLSIDLMLSRASGTPLEYHRNS